MVDLVAFAKGADLGATTVGRVRDIRNAIQDDRKLRNANEKLDVIMDNMNRAPEFINDQALEHHGHVDITTNDVNGATFDELRAAVADTLPPDASFADRINLQKQAVVYQRDYILKGLYEVHGLLEQAKKEQDPATKQTLQRLANMRSAQIHKMLPDGQGSYVETLPDGNSMVLRHSEANPQHSTGQMVLEPKGIESMINQFSGPDGAKALGMWDEQLEQEHQKIQKADMELEWLPKRWESEIARNAVLNEVSRGTLALNQSKELRDRAAQLIWGPFGSEKAYTNAIKAVDDYGSKMFSAVTARNEAQARAANGGEEFVLDTSGGIARGEAAGADLSDIPIVPERIDAIVKSGHFMQGNTLARDIQMNNPRISPLHAWDNASALIMAEAEPDKYEIVTAKNPSGEWMTSILEKGAEEGQVTLVQSMGTPDAYKPLGPERKDKIAALGGKDAMAKAGLRLRENKYPSGKSVLELAPKDMSDADIDAAVSEAQSGNYDAGNTSNAVPPDAGFTQQAALTQDTNAPTGGGAAVQADMAGQPRPEGAVPAPDEEAPASSPQSAIRTAEEAPEVSPVTPAESKSILDSVTEDISGAIEDDKMTPEVAYKFRERLAEVDPNQLDGPTLNVYQKLSAALDQIVQSSQNVALAGRRNLNAVG